MKIRNKILVILLLITLNAYTQTDTNYTYREYIKAFSSLIAESPNVDSLLFYRSWIYFTNYKYDSALLDINRAIQINHDEKMYFELKGDILYSMREYDSAINSFDKAIKIDSSKLVFYGKKVEVLLRIKKNKRALYTLLQAIENTPLVTGDKYNEMMKKYIWDVEDTLYFRFKKMYETDTNSNENLFLFGYISYLSNQYNQSKRLLLRYKENTPTKKYDYTASKILGLVFLREFDVETASYYLTEAYMNGIKIHQHLRKYINFE